MVESSKSAPGAFAAAIKKADTRTRAETILAAPQAPVANIEHGHETEPGGASAPASIPAFLMPGRPRNADGSEQAD